MSEHKKNITDYLLRKLVREFLASNYGMVAGEQELLRLLKAVRDGKNDYLCKYIDLV